MTRGAVDRLAVALCALLAFLVLWTFAYEIAACMRWTPAEGSTKWALIQRQFGDRSFATLSWETVILGPKHFWLRLVYPPMRMEALTRGGIAAVVVLSLFAALFFTWLVNRPAKHKGDARWGTLLEAARARLTGKNGLLFGTLNGRLLRSGDPAHVLVVGPSRSGKGTGFLLPNGYDHGGSSVWWDTKRENYDILARYLRDKGVKTFLFRPGATHSHRYNPLDFIRLGPSMPADCGTVASFIMPERPDDTWSGAGRMLLAALIGYVMTSANCAHQRHLRSVARMTVTGNDISKLLSRLVQSERAQLPAWVVDSFNQYISLEAETRNSAVFNVNMAMNPWNNPLISAATETSDFDIRDLRREKMAIFVCCSIAELVQFRPIIRMLFQQIHDLMMMERPKPADRYEVLLALDEFRHLGPMPQLLSMLTISAGYKFRMALVIQSISMLDELYGKAVRQTTLAGAQIKLIIKVDDLDTGNYVSELLGDRTIAVPTPLSRPGVGVFAPRGNQIHYEAQPLLSAPQLRLLPNNKSILFVTGARPLLIDKVHHYRDRPFKALFERHGDMEMSSPLLCTWSDADLGPLLSRRPGSVSGGKRNGPAPPSRKNGVQNPAPAPPYDNQSAGGGTQRPTPASNGSRGSTPPEFHLQPTPPVNGVMREYPASTVAKAITEVSSDEASKLAAIFLDQPEASQSIQDLLALQFHFGEVEDSAQ